MRLYAITDLACLGVSALAAEDALVELATQWAIAGIEVIQIREKQLAASALEKLSRRIVVAVRAANGRDRRTRILINGRADIAIAVGADGVHLPGSGALTPTEVGQLYADCHAASPVISVACHSLADIARARDQGATMALFSPVFGKVVRDQEKATGEWTSAEQEKREGIAGVGLDVLREACGAAGAMPVFALGGVNSRNARQCIEAGAAGVAGIRLFHFSEWKALAGAST